MFKNKLFMLFVLTCVLLSACGAPPAQKNFEQPVDAQAPAANVEQPAPAAQNSAPTAAAVPNQISNSETSSAVDLTHLPVGDGRVSSSPQVGYVFSCQTQFNGGGAFNSGSWMNGDGTWNATTKPTVDGSVTWPSSFTITLNGDQRVIAGNDLPDHPTGTYPVASSDDAYNFDRNPNSISAQTIQFNLPANPQLAATPTCVGMGVIGVMTTGSVFFNALDGGGLDAVAHELQDDCGGHPQQNGQYHYHNLPSCVSATGSGLVGYALDGFGIYTSTDASGRVLTNADLDECHGTTSEVEWDGQKIVMYHYVATAEYPYTVGCYRGTPVASGQSQGGQPPMGGKDGAPGQPPQAAIDACVGLAQNAACTVNTPNGTLSGTCLTPPNITQLACVPAGGPPPRP